jgi:hypothetical protein
MALAPRRALFSVPSSSIMARSICACSRASIPISTGAMISVTLAMAFKTPCRHNATVAVAQFDRLVLTGRSTRGHRGRASESVVEMDIDAQRGVAARVEDFQGVDGMDAWCHGCRPVGGCGWNRKMVTPFDVRCLRIL